MNGTAYTWDNNGNLLNDGVNTYTYDAANRLTSVVGGGNTSTYSYNGLGDRLSQTVNAATTNYALDLNAGLTQVLSDGSNTYLYGAMRVGELQAGGMTYHLGDALGSVRQLTDASGAVTLARNFEPYGKVLSSSGSGSTAYGFTGEWADNTGLIHLRARYYSPGVGRFVSQDAWRGDYFSPQTLNGWNYVLSNPINYTDPSGREPILPILVCLGLVVADGPAPIGDAVCAALLAGTAGVATFSLTVAMNPPTQYSGSQYSNFTLEQPTFPPLIFPLPEPQPSRPLIFPLPQQRLNKPLIFPLPVEGQLPCNTSPFPLRSGLNLPPYTPPFPGQLPVELQGPTVYMAKPLEWDPEPRRLIDLSNRDRYVVFDSYEPRFQAAGILEWNGELSITLRTRLENGERTPLMTGSEQFGQILGHFGNRVKAIRGHWLYGDNLQAFNEATRLGMSPKQAALMTWTGQQAVAAGFGKVKIDRLEGEPGEYTDVRVRFTK